MPFVQFIFAMTDADNVEDDFDLEVDQMNCDVEYIMRSHNMIIGQKAVQTRSRLVNP